MGVFGGIFKKEILPCPFCGLDPLVLRENGECRIECQNEDCVRTYVEDSEIRAIELWNRRSG